MKRFATLGLAALGVLFIAGLAGNFSGPRAIAQTVIRAALVKNIDEPGRSPYVSEIVSSTCSGDKTPVYCTFYFNFVPGGKRLVIEQISGELDITSNNEAVPATMQVYAANSLAGGVKLGSLGPFVTRLIHQANRTHFCFPFKGYVNGTSQPMVYAGVLSVNGAETQVSLGGTNITITGYLVDLTQ
ncbi:MAG: hypothetical protein IT166_22850 [Bryobacterales bacterium]|nr:hypothetical protein [Bryobacterales bacterium]